eukprot:755167-Hanusia_phi.AAC.11
MAAALLLLLFLLPVVPAYHSYHSMPGWTPWGKDPVLIYPPPPLLTTHHPGIEGYFHDPTDTKNFRSISGRVAPMVKLRIELANCSVLSDQGQSVT